MDDDNENPGGTASVQSRAVLFTPISYPILKSIDPKVVAQFMNERKRYENEVEEKRKEIPTLSAASYKISIDRDLLESLHFLGHFDNQAPDTNVENLTSDHIKRYLDSIIRDLSTKEVNPAVIESALKAVRVQMDIEEPKARMIQFVSTIFKRLEGVGHGDFKNKNPKKTIKLIQERLFPAFLKTAMEQHLEYSPDLKHDVKKYVQVLTDEAVTQEKSRKQYEQLRKRKQTEQPTKKVRDSKPSAESMKPKTNIPLCLDETHAKEGKRHFMSECDKVTSEAERKRLIDKKREETKKKLRAKKVYTPCARKAEMNSVTMKATFAGKETECICADGGSDINLLPRHLLSKLTSAGAKMKVEKFKNIRKFGLAAVQNSRKEPIYVSCDQQVTLNTELHIRHGKSLLLRNVPWYVAVEQCDEPLLGRPLLEALGLNTKNLIEAACDKYAGDVDVAEILPEDEYAEGSLARRIDSGIYHSTGMYDDQRDIEEGDNMFVDIGVDTEDEMQQAMKEAIAQAVANGISQTGETRLQNILNKYRDVFRLRLGNDPPARVEPMQVEISPGTKPIICKARRYSKSQRDFLEQYTAKLEEFGFAFYNSNAKWASAPLLVPKAPPAFFRLTFDQRAVNSKTSPIVWPMPHLESELMDFGSSTCFASLDFTAAYWQLPLSEESREYHSFMTPRGIMTPTRTMQGARNSVANFQSRVEPLFSSIRHALKAWLDDFALHAKTEEDLFDLLVSFLDICRATGLKMNPRKSVFFTKSLRWCGRVIDKHGVRCDPRRLSGLRHATYPLTAGELCQYVHCLQWMSNCIPDFSNRVSPLRELLEKAYTTSGSRKKKSIESVNLVDLSWGPEHSDAFDQLQETLRDAVKLSHRDVSKVICIYTDASDTHWAAVVTQCDPSLLDLPTMQQQHEPLAFLSSAFRNHECNWSTYEKEGFAIYQVFRKMDYLLMVEENIHVYADHRNFLFVFNPHSIEPGLGRYVVTKVQRWALYLSMFQYTISHVAGVENVMSDIMTRWFSGYRPKRNSARRVVELLEQSDVVPTPAQSQFQVPTCNELIKVQQKYKEKVPADAEIRSNEPLALKGRLWIPDEAHELQLTLISTAHCSEAGHRGIDSTLSALKEEYIWNHMRDDCSAFIRQCLHCITAKSGGKIPRPLSSTLHGTRPNDVVHFDYLFMGLGQENLKYVLVIKDDVSSYTWLCPSAAADSEHTSAELTRWIRTFTIMNTWISDQGSHFKNKVIECLAKDHKINHNFTVAYSPWVNGTVENLMQHILACCQALLSEFKLAPQDWPLVIGMVMTALNESPLKRLGTRPDGSYYSPLEVMTGLKPNRTHLYVQNCGIKKARKSLTMIRVLQTINIEKSQEALEKMHKDVTERITEERAKRILLHNKNTNIVSPNFSLGDLVMVRKPDKKGHKNSFRWLGPRRITAVLSPLVYDVTTLHNRKTDRVHASRMRLYRSFSADVSPSDCLMEHAVHLETQFELIDEIKDIAEGETGLLIQVKWQGLPDPQDWTWQDLLELYEDVPEELEAFLHKSGKKKLSKKAKDALGLSS